MRSCEERHLGLPKLSAGSRAMCAKGISALEGSPRARDKIYTNSEGSPPAVYKRSAMDHRRRTQKERHGGQPPSTPFGQARTCRSGRGRHEQRRRVGDSVHQHWYVLV